ncbi:MAG: DUF2442 domain-containing protein [Deltaproteobacteria bacterium]|nr:DUF2442 domain-containing protein [Deltaproteobacteria bacterium]
MEHAIYRVTGFRLVGPRALRVEFDDGTARDVDFTPVLAGEVFGPLCDPDFFRQVRIDPEAQTIVWPNGADFDPATLHDWPDQLPGLRRMAERWAGAACTDPPNDRGTADL